MNVMFVCTGNTCRSPMAEGFLKKLVSDSGKDGINVCSRGLAAATGESASKNSIIAAAEHGVNISSHASCQLSIEDVQSADLILTMTASHASAIKSAVPDAKNKVFSLSQYVASSDISDPYGGNIEVYRKSASEIMDAVKKVFLKLSDESQ